nr:hypothetical protein [uncultured Mucilaginibacter sp.]
MKVLATMFLICIGLLAKAQTFTYTMTDDGVVKDKPSAFGSPKFKVYKSDEIEIIGYLDNYWKVTSGSQTGYISELYITETVALREFKDRWIAAAKEAAILKQKEEFAAKPTKAQLIKKYGLRYGTDVFNGTIRMGMSPKMVTEVIGKPDEVNRTVTAYSTHEQWVYNKENEKTEYYYFDNGKLTAWQD